MASLPHAAARFLRAVFGREELPAAPAPAPPTPAGRATLSVLFAPEDLPEDPALPTRGRGRWLAWLFAPERLDD